MADAHAPSREMERIAQDLPTKSAKIRALAAAGYSRAEIARFLNIRYQHVRNVLTGSAPKPAKTEAEPLASTSVKIDSAGRIVIPSGYRDALGIKEGDTLVLSLEGGEVRLLPYAEAIRRAQEIVARHVPPGVSLADELIEERRREAMREEEDG